MRIAVNVRLLIKDRLEGIGWFSYENLKRITQSHPEHDFIFIFDRPYDPEFIFADNVKPIVIAPSTRHPLLYIVWFEFRIPQLLKKLKADLFLSPDGFLSLRSKTTQIAVIHDINFAHRPKDLPWAYRKYYNYFFPRFAKKAKRLGTVSTYSKKDITTTYHVPEEKIDVLYNGVNEIYSPIDEKKKDTVRANFSNGNPYYLFVGAFSARKNIRNLILAFNQFKEKNNNSFKLLLVGEPLFNNQHLHQTYELLTYKNDILFLGRQSPENLHLLLASAHALSFVPFFEGFGIPVAEAIQCEVPIICSNTTSIPEVAGEAALFVNPNKVEEIAEAMQTMAENKQLRNKLIEKTKKQKNQFTWDKSAQRFWETIEKVLNNDK